MNQKLNKVLTIFLGMLVNWVVVVVFNRLIALSFIFISETVSTIWFVLLTALFLSNVLSYYIDLKVFKFTKKQFLISTILFYIFYFGFLAFIIYGFATVGWSF